MCTHGARALQLWVTFSNAAVAFNLRLRHSAGEKPLLIYLPGMICSADILMLKVQRCCFFALVTKHACESTSFLCYGCGPSFFCSRMSPQHNENPWIMYLCIHTSVYHANEANKKIILRRWWNIILSSALDFLSSYILEVVSVF